MIVNFHLSAFNKSNWHIMAFLSGGEKPGGLDVPPSGKGFENRDSTLSLDHDVEIESDILGIHRDWWPLLARWF